MTLIIGARCSDGIVMGADSAATSASFGHQICKQPIKKLEIIGSNIILGMSGPVGLGQIFKTEIEKHHATDVWHKQDYLTFDGTIRKILWPHLEQEYSNTELMKKVYGELAVHEVLNDTLLAIQLKDGLHLINISHRCSLQEATLNYPLMAIGSGEQIAIPFLAFLRRILWSDKPPHVSDGILIIYWTLQHSILTAPSGVAAPYQLAELKKDTDDKWKARLLSDDEINETKEAVDGLEKEIGNNIHKLFDNPKNDIMIQ